MDFFFNNIFPLMFTIVPVFVIGMFIFVFTKIFRQWNQNNKSPVLNVQATVAAITITPPHTFTSCSKCKAATAWIFVLIGCNIANTLKVMWAN